MKIIYMIIFGHIQLKNLQHFVYIVQFITLPIVMVLQEEEDYKGVMMIVILKLIYHNQYLLVQILHRWMKFVHNHVMMKFVQVVILIIRKPLMNVVIIILCGSVKCLNNRTLLSLDFNIDQFFVEDGYDTLLDYSYRYSSVTGGNSTAMIFNGSTRLDLEALDLEALDLDEELYVTNFKISFRFKPYSISYDRLLSIDNDNVKTILQDNNANCATSHVNAQYLGLFKVGNNTWNRNVGEGLTIGGWNTIEMPYLDDGETTKVAYAYFSDFADVDVALQFNEWYIGDDNNDGINGELDQSTLKQVETIRISSVDLNGVTIVVRKVQNDDYETWLALGIVFLIISIFQITST